VRVLVRYDGKACGSVRTGTRWRPREGRVENWPGKRDGQAGTKGSGCSLGKGERAQAGQQGEEPTGGNVGRAERGWRQGGRDDRGLAIFDPGFLIQDRADGGKGWVRLGNARVGSNFMTVENGTELSETDRMEFLLALLRGEGVGAAAPEAWQRVAELARQQRVAELLFWRLKKPGLCEQVPAEVLEELHGAALLAASQNARSYHNLRAVFERFQEQGIPAILLKGAYLAEHIYGNIGARPMGDVDLLVKQADLKRAGALLLGLGFVRPPQPDEPIKAQHHFVYEHAGKGLYLELHWDLIDRVYPIHVDMPGLWERSQATRVAGLAVREMTPEDQVLHLCIHASKHVFEFGLRGMCDLAETLRKTQAGLDWEKLGRRADAWNARRCVYVNLRLAKDLLEAPLPEQWLRGLAPADLEGRYMQIARENLLAGGEGLEADEPSWPRVVELWAARSWRRKALLFWKRLSLPRALLAVKYGVRADSLRVWLYYPVRLKDLLLRDSATGWRLVRGDAALRNKAAKQEQANLLKRWMFTA
jgi:hypothetical protein